MILTLEQQVCSLELAKKLKELRVRQNSLFYHYNEPYYDGEDDWLITTFDEYEVACENKSEPYSAFTVSELMKILPIINSTFVDIVKGVSFKHYNVVYSCRYYNESIIGNLDENLANACANTLIHILENKLITIEEINK